eukprot:2210851-Pyramimonas_sp.AAC.1
MLHRPHGPPHHAPDDVPDEVDHHCDEGVTRWTDINLCSRCYLDIDDQPELRNSIVHGGQRSQRAHLLEHRLLVNSALR